MPGLVVFRRRWSVGSDDLVVPGAFLFTVHLIWTIILTTLLIVIEFDLTTECVLQLWQYIIGYMGILGLSLLLELAICIVAMRGSILDTQPRTSMQYILYVRLAVMVIEMGWLILGAVWVVYYYTVCHIDRAKETVLAMIICNACILLSVLMTVWCTWDAAGRSWVKMKQYQRSMRESESRFQYKRSGNTNRNWRQRKVIRAYQDSWDQRCRLLFCCMRGSDRNRNSFADIAKLLSDFFRDLDVVPSDVVAGLVLLRKFQKIEREAIVKERKNDTYEFLSGVAVTPRTQFLRLNDPHDLELFQTVIHYMHYALAAYGWPVYLMSYATTEICQLCTKLRCACLPCFGRPLDISMVVEDNCCQCNFAALQQIVSVGEVDVIHATFHVDIGETPFFIAVDYGKRKIVICVRGTLSMKDVITDLNADSEPLPLNPPREDWLGHKGMVLAAVYIKDKIAKEGLLDLAFNHNPEKGTQDFGLVLVGHSLGAGTASILAILLRQDYPDLKCYSYAPPGGLLSLPAVEYSKEFITSVVVGKDVVPRIGLHQMESLRGDLINAIKRSVDPKWKTITCSVVCCCTCCAGSTPTSVATLQKDNSYIDAYSLAKGAARCGATVHPSDSSIALTLHRPLYPPGKIIHVVRHHPSGTEKKYENRWRQALSKNEPVYQAVWADNTDFDEVLISPVMIQDHMPDKVLDALNKVVTTFGPRKPQRTSSSITSADRIDPEEQCHLLVAAANALGASHEISSGLESPSKTSPPAPHRLCLETSFTSLQSPTIEIYNHHNNDSSLNSSLTGSFYPSKISPIQLSSILYPDMHSRSPSWQHQVSQFIGGYSSNITSPQSLNWNHHFMQNGSSVKSNNSSNNGHELSGFPSAHENLQRKSSIPNDVLLRCTNYQTNIKTNIRPQNKTESSPQRFRSSYSMTTFDAKAKAEQFKMRPKNFSLDICKKVDLIHDDWFGLAPLASPESLSEVSSISSRASFGLHYERTNLTEVLSTSYELHTPKVMRRTPKIPGNLSTCADDIKSVRYFQKLGRSSTFLRCSSQNGSSRTNSSGDLSYESATSVNLSRCCSKNELMDTNNKGVDRSHLENKFLSNVLKKKIDSSNTNTSTETESYQSAENILSESKHSDDKLSKDCTSGCPNCPCKYSSDNNLEIQGKMEMLRRRTFINQENKKCCPNYDHAECVFQTKEKSISTSSELYQSSKSTPEIKNLRTEILYPHIENKPKYLETHFDDDFFTVETNIPSKCPEPIKRSPQNLKIALKTTTQQRLPKNNQISETSNPNFLSPTLPSPGKIESHFIPSSSSCTQSLESPGKPDTKLQIFSPQILSPATPEIDPDIISNFAIDLNMEPENRTILHYTLTASAKVPEPKGSSSIDSGSICKTPSETKTVSFSPQIINIDPSIVQKGFHEPSVSSTNDLKSIMKETAADHIYVDPSYSYKNIVYFPKETQFDIKNVDLKSKNDPKNTLNYDNCKYDKKSKKSDKWYLLPKRSPKKSQKEDSSSKLLLRVKNETDNEQCFSKNESLPLLSGLNSSVEKTSPSYVRRKKYIYPITKVGRGESSV